MTWYKGVIVQVLLMEIEIAREEMVEVALAEGFTSVNAVHVSQYIDRLLNLIEEI